MIPRDFITDKAIADRASEGEPPWQRTYTRDHDRLEDRERRIRAHEARVVAGDKAEALKDCRPVRTADKDALRRCDRCGVGLLVHDVSAAIVSGTRQVRHIHTCPACGWWCWGRARIW